MCITPFNSIDSLIVVIESMDFLNTIYSKKILKKNILVKSPIHKLDYFLRFAIFVQQIITHQRWKSIKN